MSVSTKSGRSEQAVGSDGEVAPKGTVVCREAGEQRS